LNDPLPWAGVEMGMIECDRSAGDNLSKAIAEGGDGGIATKALLLPKEDAASAPLC
jgi:hypothetical protein